MRRVNRYKGVLQPRQVGAPRDEAPLLLLYDIEDDRIRLRVSSACLDFGLERIQFSAFFGRLTRNKRQEMQVRILREVNGENARLKVVPLSWENLEEMWTFDNWRVDADDLKAKADAVAVAPSIRIVRITDD